MANILIVDDSKTSRRIMRGILEGDGHIIVGEALNGEMAIQLYEELKPDIVTMDITMPVMDGLEALKQIRSRDAKARIIMVTAAGQVNKVMEAVKCGAAEFLSKPFDADHICEVINRLTSGKEK